jgi:hypothetical protein
MPAHRSRGGVAGSKTGGTGWRTPACTTSWAPSRHLAATGANRPSDHPKLGRIAPVTIRNWGESPQSPICHWGKSPHQLRGKWRRAARGPWPEKSAFSAKRNVFQVPPLEIRRSPPPLARGLHIPFGTTGGFRTARRESVQCLCFVSVAMVVTGQFFHSFRFPLSLEKTCILCESRIPTLPQSRRLLPRSFFQPHFSRPRPVSFGMPKMLLARLPVCGSTGKGSSTQRL